ncbi:MAG: DUF2066 domain-containing protein [Gammaproteobacteria bacterium]|nr:DUF2066 domain-containing protein [Gammaproteobacteria bacterium]
MSAEVVDWLYSIEVPVASQKPADRQRAARVALQQVLTRLTGLRNVPMSEPVLDALARPERYYAQYSFTSWPNGESGFQVRFESEALRALINRASLPIWGANRPKILAWLVIDSEPEREVLGAASLHPLAVGIRARARARGLPVALPLMDLEDQLSVGPSAVWGSLSETLYVASARYEADLLLIGRATERAMGTWVTSWEFWLQDGEREFTFETRTAEEGAELALDEVADELMQRFAVLGRDLEVVDLAVGGASSLVDYAAMMAYLYSLEFIDRVEVTRVTARQIDLRVHTRGSRVQLKDLFAADGRLIPEPAYGYPAGPLVKLTWQGVES